jgi:acetolactate synthase regulatory subunit
MRTAGEDGVRTFVVVAEDTFGTLERALDILRRRGVRLSALEARVEAHRVVLRLEVSGLTDAQAAVVAAMLAALGEADG